MRLIITKDADEAGRLTANHIARRINDRTRDKFVLGLPTGSTPLPTYKALIELYEQGKVSFADVLTFNMDEYCGLDADHPQSYHRFMHDNFFRFIDIPAGNISILDGMAADRVRECEAYEEKIAAAGGIDLFLGGVGEDGHIAFNEPFSSMSSLTREKTLTQDTIRANARFFDGDLSRVPTTALTVGIATIMSAREVVILATGNKKARALRDAVEGPYSHVCPLSAIQSHRKGIIVCDEAAASMLGSDTLAYFRDIEKRCDF